MLRNKGVRDPRGVDGWEAFEDTTCHLQTDMPSARVDLRHGTFLPASPQLTPAALEQREGHIQQVPPGEGPCGSALRCGGRNQIGYSPLGALALAAEPDVSPVTWDLTWVEERRPCEASGQDTPRNTSQWAGRQSVCKGLSVNIPEFEGLRSLLQLLSLPC